MMNGPSEAATLERARNLAAEAMFTVSLQRRRALSRPTSSCEGERSRRRSRRLAVTERSQDGVEHQVQFLAHVFGKEAQHQIAILLQHLILAPVAPVRDRIREMLRAVEFHRHTRVGAEEIDFQSS